jgi:epoxide hydrolase 4
VPQLRLVRVPGATHWIVHEQPARVAAEIDAALAGVPSC